MAFRVESARSSVFRIPFAFSFSLFKMCLAFNAQYEFQLYNPHSYISEYCIGKQRIVQLHQFLDHLKCLQNYLHILYYTVLYVRLRKGMDFVVVTGPVEK